MKVHSTKIKTNLDNFVKEYLAQTDLGKYNIGWEWVVYNLYYNSFIDSPPKELCAFHYHLQLHAGIKPIHIYKKYLKESIKSPMITFKIVDEKKYLFWLLKYT